MRKLVMLCYGVLKSRRPFDPASVHESPLDNTLPGSVVEAANATHHEADAPL